MDGGPKEAARDPEPLCEAIGIGLINEMVLEARKLMQLCTVKATDKVESRDTPEHEEKEEESEEECRKAWDDLSGGELGPKMVMKARQLELSYIHEKEVWVKITRKEALRRGLKVIGVRWIDVNKGDYTDAKILFFSNFSHFCNKVLVKSNEMRYEQHR